MNGLWPWLTLFGLGAFHGINPAMGWLFAVGLGLQEQKRTAVLRALPPIALGHALSIGIIIAAVLLARISVPGFALKIAAAAILFAFGLYRLFRSRHPNWVGMRVGFGDLTLWSFVMASAHGAGLMLIPLFLKSPPQALAPHGGAMALHMHPTHGFEFANFSTPSLLTSSIAVHTLGYLLITGLVAILVYERLGVGILRRAWFNVDVFWMLALMVTGLFILFL
ncbi:MAG TPA: hypothetical protein VGQ70_04435 [Candidatus Udaeobacter sp.]|nr:hypothetical protein [Candidatus Udaeobacter sp.]